MKIWIIRYSFFFAGLLLFGFANAMAVKVKYLGLHPWEVLNVALFQQFGFSIGTWSVLVGLAVIAVAWFVNRKYINIGTFLNTLLIGPFMDFFLWLDFLPEATHAWQDYAQLFTAILISSIAGGLYVAGGVGAGPRDGFMLSLSERTRLSVSQARILVECLVLVIGYLIGGPVGVVTFLYTFIQSPLFQITLRFFQKLRIFLTEESTEPVQVGEVVPERFWLEFSYFFVHSMVLAAYTNYSAARVCISYRQISEILNTETAFITYSLVGPIRATA